MLSERDRLVLEFESAWWHYPQPKDLAIRDYLDMSANRYYQILRRVVDDPEAAALQPLTIYRLRRDRATARRQALDRRRSDA
ncbi:MAG: DUF3263 domain-containing protein [Acidimicrobiia bacterium]